MPSDQLPPSAPPPEYTVEEAGPSTSERDVNQPGPGPLQVLIVPTQHATDFENGALGVEGEHATVEGEVQIKGAVPGAWQTVTITFRSMETSSSQSVELASRTQTLYSIELPKESSSTTTIPELPSILPFSLPLAPDTPECIHTPASSLSHYLSAKLSPTDPSAEAFETKIPIHLRRYSTPNSPFLPILPHSITMESPSPVTIQLPRLEFRVGEPIPVYITVPPPNRQSISESGLRLRNAKAELIRYISLNDSSSTESGRNTPVSAIHNPLGEGSSTSYSPFFTDKKINALKDGQLGTLSALHDDTLHSAVMSRSGAACRFHSSRPVQLRLVLHPFSLSAEVTASGQQPLSRVHEEREADGCASISQTTPLHTVSFYLLVRMGFISSVDRTDVTVEQSIPITMIPGLAPVQEDITAVQYSKKHDPPPDKTYRYDDQGDGESLSAPPFTAYDTASGMAGLSTPDADPPPFFSEPGTSHPPSFVEAENQVASSSSVRLAEWSATDPLGVAVLRIPGEGDQFGFTYENIYDGFGDGARTPPPPLAASEQAGRLDARRLADLINDTGRLQGIGINRNGTGDAPPPPPAMDDPMDPPPAIDDAFRVVPPHPEQEDSIHPPAEPSQPTVSVLPPPATASSHRTAAASEAGPPPYLSPPGQQQAEPAEPPGPPPYTDFAGAPPAA